MEKSLPDYFGKPPLVLGQGSGGGVRRQAALRLKRLWGVLWQTFVPFNSEPEPPEDIPAPANGDISAEQLLLAKEIFERSEKRRSQLEQKAQWTFGLLGVLVPLLIPAVLFLSKEGARDDLLVRIGLWIFGVAATLILLAVISIMRAMAIQNRSELFIGAVVNTTTGEFREYSRHFEARGLMQCAAVNTALNDHMAQFVRGAQVFAAAAILALLAGIGPVAFSYAKTSNETAITKVEGTVAISSPSLQSIVLEVRELRAEFRKYFEKRNNLPANHTAGAPTPTDTSNSLKN